MGCVVDALGFGGPAPPRKPHACVHIYSPPPSNLTTPDPIYNTTTGRLRALHPQLRAVWDEGERVCIYICVREPATAPWTCMVWERGGERLNDTFTFFVSFIGGPLHRHRAPHAVARHATHPRILRGLFAALGRDFGPESAHSVRLFFPWMGWCGMEKPVVMCTCTP